MIEISIEDDIWNSKTIATLKSKINLMMVMFEQKNRKEKKIILSKIQAKAVIYFLQEAIDLEDENTGENQ